MSKNQPYSESVTIDTRIPYEELSRSQTTKDEKDALPPDEPQEVTPQLLPIPSCRDNCKCNNCGEPWNDGEEWTVHVIEKQSDSVHQSIGNLYKYECPNCECKSFQRVSGVTTDHKY